MKILVVYHEEKARKLTVDILEGLENVVVEQAASVPNAVKYLEQVDEPFDYVITPSFRDIGYEGCDWKTIYEAAETAGTTFILYSGRCQELREAQRKGIQALECSSYPQELLNTIRSRSSSIEATSIPAECRRS